MGAYFLETSERKKSQPVDNPRSVLNDPHISSSRSSSICELLFPKKEPQSLILEGQSNSGRTRFWVFEKEKYTKQHLSKGARKYLFHVNRHDVLYANCRCELLHRHDSAVMRSFSSFYSLLGQEKKN